MNLSDLQEKEVIDISTGKRIGTIIDVTFTVIGNISKLILEDRKASRKLFGNSREDVYLDWKQIIKIGDDIILVDCKERIDFYNWERYLEWMVKF